jgi:hypothetical protein
MEYPKQLAAQVIISDHELISLPRDLMEEKIQHELTILLAREIIKSKSFTLTEEPDFRTMSKRIRAEVVVMSKEDYHRLLTKSMAADKAKEILNKF